MGVILDMFVAAATENEAVTLILLASCICGFVWLCVVGGGGIEERYIIIIYKRERERERERATSS